MKKRTLFPILAALSLTGCQENLVQVQATCSANSPSFVANWHCIRERVATRGGTMNSAQGARYLAVGDAIAEQVESGKLTDIQAKAQLAVELEHDDSQYRQNHAAQAASGPAICNQVGQTTICN